MLKAYPQKTLKRKLLCIYVFVRQIISSLFGSRKELLKLDAKDFWLRELSDENHHFVFWSTVEGRNRCYVHSYRYGEMISFSKIAYDGPSLLLSNECESLRKLSLRDNNFNIPEVLNFIEKPEYAKLTMTSMPKRLKLYHPDSQLFPRSLDICGGKAEESSIHDLWYVKKFLVDDLRFLNCCRRIRGYPKNEKLKIGFQHGDFGSENLYYSDRDSFYVIDWERASTDLPLGIDEVSFLLGKYHAEILGEKGGLEMFLNAAGVFEKKVLFFSLICLHRFGFNLSTKVLEKIDNEDIF
jgi:hypothetical protein